MKIEKIEDCNLFYQILLYAQCWPASCYFWLAHKTFLKFWDYIQRLIKKKNKKQF